MRFFNMILLSTLSTLSPMISAKNIVATTTFNSLKSLVGDWQGRDGDRVVSVNYRLTANDSALVETWTMSPTRESITIYTLDGERLIATHYCPQGNQPRLRLRRQDADGKLQFQFLDGTGLQDKTASHQHAMWIKIDSADSFTRSETYIQNGTKFDPAKPSDEVIQFERTK
jgi:hypothetical protein